MVEILNKKVVVCEKPTCYFELIGHCNNVTPKEGYSIDFMKKSIKVDGLIDDFNIDAACFENEHFTHIKNAVNSMPWAVKDIEVLNFHEYINSLKES